MSCELLAKFDEMVARFKKEFSNIIEKEREKMKAEIEAYNAEKGRMETVLVRDDDIIHLDVSGLKLKTNRSTLCQVQGSLLASMFSGRWEDSVQRDQDGAVFLDFNPQHFTVILDYLRVKKIATPENPAPLPNVPEDQMKEFNILIEYLGLNDELKANSDLKTVPVVREKFNLHSASVILEDSGQVARKCPNQREGYVLGDNIYHQGETRIKLSLESLGDTVSMFFGIVRGDIFALQINTNLFQWPGSYGWGFGKNGPGTVWEDGEYTMTNISTTKTLMKTGDTITLVLDCDAGKLSLHLAAGPQFHIDIPKFKTWKLNVYFAGPNHKIRIINE